MSEHFTTEGLVIGAALIVGAYAILELHVADTKRDKIWRLAGFLFAFTGFLVAFGKFFYQLGLHSR